MPSASPLASRASTSPARSPPPPATVAVATACMRKTMPVEALAAPTISHASTSAFSEPPAPPCSTGTSRPSAPTPANASMSASGKLRLRSTSAAPGAIWVSATSRTAASTPATSTTVPSVIDSTPRYEGTRAAARFRVGHSSLGHAHCGTGRMPARPRCRREYTVLAPLGEHFGGLELESSPARVDDRRVPAPDDPHDGNHHPGESANSPRARFEACRLHPRRPVHRTPRSC